MAEPKRSNFERERDLAIVADMYLRAKTQMEIAEHLNTTHYPDRPLSRQQIGYDIRILIGRWQKGAERKIDERKAEELARIDRLEREYWDAWERSKLDAESSVTEKIEGRDVRLKAQMRKEGQTGDPRYLAGVQWCIQARREILGIDAPKKSDITSGGQPIKSNDGHDRAISSLADALREIVSGAATSEGNPVDAAEQTTVVSTTEPGR